MRFNNNPKFEEKLEEINALFSTMKDQRPYPPEMAKQFPLVLKLGSSRSGSTVFTQWVASQRQFSYPSNFLSLFYAFPALGARIYELLTNPDLKYNNEFQDLYREIDYKSVSGKTTGMKSPHEFWRFWLEYFDFPRIPSEQEEWVKTADFHRFNRDVAEIIQVFNKPFFLKAHNLNYYLEIFAKNVENAVFLHMYRNPIDVINSVINARMTRYGDINYFFGWRPREYDRLKYLDVYHQVAGQVYFNEKAILDRRHVLGDRYLSFSYEDFCQNPTEVFHQIVEKINQFSSTILGKNYTGPDRFETSRCTDEEQLRKINAALDYWVNRHGPLEYSNGN